MKITNKQLRKIIKEELDNIVQEENNSVSQEDIKAGEAFANSKLGKQIIAKLDKNPQVQKALRQAMNNDLNEAEPGAEGRMTGAMIGAGAVASPTGMVKMGMAGAAGKALMGSIGSVLGIAGAGAAIFLTPIVIGYLLDKAAHNAEEKKRKERGY